MVETENNQPHRAGRRWPATLVHGALPILLGSAIAGQYWFAQRSHLTARELDEALLNGSARQQVYALHVMVNRGKPPEFNRSWLRSRLSSDNVLMRELMMTPNMMKYGRTRIRRRAIEEIYTDPDAIIRADFLLAYRVGAYNAMSLDELRRFLDAASDGS